jgi:hypothetical protein
VGIKGASSAAVKKRVRSLWETFWPLNIMQSIQNFPPLLTNSMISLGYSSVPNKRDATQINVGPKLLPNLGPPCLFGTQEYTPFCKCRSRITIISCRKKMTPILIDTFVHFYI